MPQLMPLMWIYSSFMVMFIIMMMINMYFYKEDYSMNILIYNFLVKKNYFKW